MSKRIDIILGELFETATSDDATRLATIEGYIIALEEVIEKLSSNK